MKKITTTLLAGLSVAVFIPSTLHACDGACGGGASNTIGNTRHHRIGNQAPQAGAGEGLNHGVNLSLDQNAQGHNQPHDKKGWADHKKNKANS